MMWGNMTSFKMTKLYPGTEGIGSGVGFEFNGAEINISAIYNHSQTLSKEDDLEKWIDLFRDADGLIFVMDLEGDTNIVKTEMDRLTEHGLILRPSVPFAVFACKQEFNQSSDIISPTPKQIAEQLKLDELERPWCVRSVEVQKLDGVYQGIDWIMSWV